MGWVVGEVVQVVWKALVVKEVALKVGQETSVVKEVAHEVALEVVLEVGLEAKDAMGEAMGVQPIPIVFENQRIFPPCW